jgi:disulfide bond formation protein DsbB
MDQFTAEINTIFSFLTVLSQLFVLFLLYCLLRGHGKVTGFFGKYAIWLGFVISLGATLTSLLYSDVIGFDPCTLCWVQRLFIYPQVILFGLALWRKERVIVDYSLALSIVGGLIAVYHYYGQMFNTGALPCKAAEGVSPCAIRFFVEFGYVTIPMMSLTAFMLLIAFMALSKKYSKGLV